MPYALKLAKHGYQAALDDSSLKKGINIHAGEIVHAGVLEAVGAPVAAGKK